MNWRPPGIAISSARIVFAHFSKQNEWLQRTPEANRWLKQGVTLENVLTANEVLNSLLFSGSSSYGGSVEVNILSPHIKTLANGADK
jgi:hypothetical protein